MNFNKYALVMFAFVGVVSIMMGISSSSYAQTNQTSTTSPSMGSSNQTSTSPSMGSSNQTSIASSNPTTPTADKNNSTSTPSSTSNTSPQATSKNASGPMDMIKNLFKSFMGGNK
jgi:hypothetical protein